VLPDTSTHSRRHGATLRRGTGLVAFAALAAFAATQLACGGNDAPAAGSKNVIVLGFDGLDYDLTQKLMDEGRMPNFARLTKEGTWQPLGTSVPPQSPVAWSDFITGMDSGGHGIFDFVHRDPETMLPYLSTSKAADAKPPMELGECSIATGGGEMQLLRYGTPFWEVLEERGIETSILRMPANFPPSEKATRELSGMGTPDMLGTYGTFSFYTSELFFDRKVNGGEIYEAWPEDGVVHGQLFGPDNPFVREKKKATADFQVHVDPESPVAKLVVGSEERILQVGEWTDWVPVELDLGKCALVTGSTKLPAMARFYLQSLTPEFELYVSPLQIDPVSPAMPISYPADYAAHLAEATGRFYTQGMPEDTKALNGKIFDREEFLAQAKLSRDEMVAQYRDVLADFTGGLLFYYMGTADQVSHTMWDTLDPGHPAYDPAEDAKYADVIPAIYAELDAMVGYTLENMPENTTVVVMSDHGFASWRRAFHLNSWLRDNGYLTPKDPDLEEDPGFFANVDWSRTRAYGAGINGLYVNVAGREKEGIVPAAEREAVMRELREKLLAIIDPATGLPAITRVYIREQDFHDRGHLEVGPDLVIGYAEGVRCSGESAMGELTKEVIEDNLEDWPGDHLMDHTTVPGILLTNRPLGKPVTTLRDLAGVILAELGVEGFPAREQAPARQQAAAK
jgi:predicted AlkP superfamily phosphohydrolase/phosphomutase